MHAYLVQCANVAVLVVFSTDDNSETLERSAINGERSMLAIFLTVLCKVDCLETETLK